VTVQRHDEPLPPEALEQLRRCSASTLATQLYKRGIRQPLWGIYPPSGQTLAEYRSATAARR
jgi:hypothetical protein